MSYARCATAVANAPVGIVWALLVDPAGWGHVFDVRIDGLDPPGPAVAGERFRPDNLLLGRRSNPNRYPIGLRHGAISARSLGRPH
jgi:hypothetical protein